MATHALKTGGRLNYWWWLVVGIVVLFAAVFIWRATPPASSSQRLYNKAMGELKKGKLRQAVADLTKLAKEQPKYRDTGAHLAQAKRQLYNQARKKLAGGNLAGATADAQALANSDPNDPGATDLQNAINQQGGGGDNTGGGSASTGGDSPGTGGGTASSGDGALKPISDASTPVDLLVARIIGYTTQQNGWLHQPINAGSTYLPKDPAIKAKIDRILTTIGKYSSGGDAQAQLDLEKQLYPKQPETIRVNGHDAYFALYNEAYPDKFPYMAALTWRRDNWFFSVAVLPLTMDASTDLKRNLAIEIAQALGY